MIGIGDENGHVAAIVETVAGIEIATSEDAIGIAEKEGQGTDEIEAGETEMNEARKGGVAVGHARNDARLEGLCCM